MTAALAPIPILVLVLVFVREIDPSIRRYFEYFDCDYEHEHRFAEHEKTIAAQSS